MCEVKARGKISKFLQHYSMKWEIHGDVNWVLASFSSTTRELYIPSTFDFCCEVECLFYIEKYQLCILSSSNFNFFNIHLASCAAIRCYHSILNVNNVVLIGKLTRTLCLSSEEDRSPPCAQRTCVRVGVRLALGLLRVMVRSPRRGVPGGWTGRGPLGEVSSCPAVEWGAFFSVQWRKKLMAWAKGFFPSSVETYVFSVQNLFRKHS